MRVDPTLRAWANETLQDGLTAEKLSEIDERYFREFERQQTVEKKKARVVLLTKVGVTLLTGFIFDRVCLALGMPKEWLLSNGLLHIWHQIVG